MKQVLLYLLVVLHLFAGMVFSWDSHPEVFFGHYPHNVIVAIDADQDSPSLDGDRHTGHHCCHGVAHLLAIHHTDLAPFFGCGQYNLTPLIQSPRSFYIVPLLRPPIV